MVCLLFFASFEKQNIFIFMKLNLLIFSSLIHAICALLTKSLLPWATKIFT